MHAIYSALRCWLFRSSVFLIPVCRISLTTVFLFDNNVGPTYEKIISIVAFRGGFYTADLARLVTTVTPYTSVFNFVFSF